MKKIFQQVFSVLLSLTMLFSYNSIYFSSIYSGKNLDPVQNITNVIDSPKDKVPASDSWIDKTKSNIIQAEYNSSIQSYFPYSSPSVGKTAYHFTNRANNLRSYIDETGWTMKSRTDDLSWYFHFESQGLTRDNKQLSFSQTSFNNLFEKDQTIIIPRVTNNIYVDEWYKNSSLGVEQGFTVKKRLEGKGNLQLIANLNTDLNILSATDKLTFSKNNQDIFNLSKLVVTDSKGNNIPAQFNFNSTNNQLAMIIDDSNAYYPITIDPLATTASWTSEADQASAYFGWSVSDAGDVNGDTFDDVIVGARLYDSGENNEGTVYVWHGSAAGLGDSGTPANADWSAQANQISTNFGISVSTAGDVNGDTFDDIIVSASYYSNGQANEGAVYVWHGSAAGLGDAGTPANADWSAESNQASAGFGNSVSTAGDVNGDTFDDVIVGAPFYDNAELSEGAVFVWYGGAAGLGDAGTPLNADWTAESNQASTNFGISVSTAGDINGDTFDDIIVGANNYDNVEANEGGAFVWYGAAAGLGDAGTLLNVDWTAESNQASAAFGISVSTAGDVNGDTYDDVIVGANGYDNGQADEGGAFVWYGAATGLGDAGTLLNADWTAELNQASAAFGISVSTAGDVNGDTYDDVIVGANLYDNGQADEGAAFVWYGSAVGLGDAGTSTNADWTGESNQASAYFGISVSTAGDVNGDTFDDVIVGAYFYDNTEADEGRAFVYNGSETILPTISSFSPADNSTGILLNTNLIINFSENVVVGTGNIVIKKSDDSIHETIVVTSSQVTGTGTSTITINLNNDLSSNTSYYVQIDSTAFDDSVGNSYAGISDKTVWNFTTEEVASAPNPNNNPTYTPSCNSQVPTSSPDLFNITTDANSAKLYFTPVNPVTNYVVSYGEKDTADTYSATFNINQTQGIVTLDIYSLNPHTTYYFKVRGLNSCAPGPWSNTRSQSTFYLGGVAIVDTVVDTNINNPSPSPAPVPTRTQNDQTIVNEDTQTGGYDLNIKIINQGQPLVGAKVELHSNLQTGTTDNEGMINFINVEGGSHDLRIAYNNFEANQQLEITGPEKQINLTILVTLKYIIPLWVWISLIIILLMFLLTLIIFLKSKKQKNEQQQNTVVLNNNQ